MNKLYPSVDHRAGPLKKSNLQYLQYYYSPGSAGGDDPTKRGAPDNFLLNRNEWYEMLYFVNKFANTYRNSKPSAALKAERLIKTVVPMTLRSQQHIESYLLQYWDIYQ